MGINPMVRDNIGYHTGRNAYLVDPETIQSRWERVLAAENGEYTGDTREEPDWVSEGWEGELWEYFLEI